MSTYTLGATDQGARRLMDTSSEADVGQSQPCHHTPRHTFMFSGQAYTSKSLSLSRKRRIPLKLSVRSTDLPGKGHRLSIRTRSAPVTSSNPTDGSHLALPPSVDALSKVEQDNAQEAERIYKAGPVQIDKGLYLGNRENAKDSRLLARLKVDRVLCVAAEIPSGAHESDPHGPGQGVKRLNLPWTHDHQHVLEEVPTLLKFVQGSENETNPERATLVHCAMGISRSATVVIAIIMQRHRWTFAKAYAYVKSKAPWIGPNMPLVYQLCTLERKMRAEGALET